MLTKGVNLERQVSIIEERSSKERSSGSDSWLSHYFTCNLNLNVSGVAKSPAVGDNLLFISTQTTLATGDSTNEEKYNDAELLTSL